jgi:hypothetical protein
LQDTAEHELAVLLAACVLRCTSFPSAVNTVDGAEVSASKKMLIIIWQFSLEAAAGPHGISFACCLCLLAPAGHCWA